MSRLQGNRIGSGTQPTPVETSSTRVNANSPSTTTGPISSRYVNIDETTKRRQLTLTQEQQKKIEANRQKAMEIRQRLGEKLATASSVLTPATVDITDTIRLNKNLTHDSDFFKQNSSKYQPPSIKKGEYIEYDFSTMTDSKGGFLEPEAEETTFQEKEREKKVIYEPAPPTDPSTAPKCQECQSIDIDRIFYDNFQVRICRKCKQANPDKYSLLTKTECREDYLLTEPELADIDLLPRIEKANPHGYSKMQLFLRLQIEQHAWKKWGGAEQLDEEWERRETNKLKRKEKKYRQQLLEMRKKTRAEEFTRKLRNGQGLGERHVHDWSAPLSLGDNMTKKRCIDCGVEIEEMII